jgi:hypothetical protein
MCLNNILRGLTKWFGQRKVVVRFLLQKLHIRHVGNSRCEGWRNYKLPLKMDLSWVHSKLAKSVTSLSKRQLVKVPKHRSIHAVSTADVIFHAATSSSASRKSAN